MVKWYSSLGETQRHLSYGITVLLASRRRWTRSAITPAIYLPLRDGRLSWLWCWLCTRYRDGLPVCIQELTTWERRNRGSNSWTG